MDDLHPSKWRGTHVILFLVAVSSIVIIDQATKAAVRNLLVSDGSSAPLIPGVLELYLTHNTGAAFSLGEGAGLLFIIAALAISAIALYTIWTTPELPLSLVVTMAAVAGGGLGNMIDRIGDGAVTDFLKTLFMNFPVFNVADIFVTLGISASFVLWIIWDKRQSAAEARERL